MDNVEKEYSSPIITIEGVQLPKLENGPNENEMRMDSLNAKAVNALVYALRADEFCRVYNCEMPKNFWTFRSYT